MNNGRAKVLIVDDTPDNIHILMESLKDRFAISAATSGARALALAQSQSPDIILLDVVMPTMDGYEVCRQLAQDVRTKSIPVIFITSLSEEEDEARGLDLGAVDFITKPFSPSLVKARVRNHIELKRHRDNLQDLVDEQVEEIADSHISTIFAMSKLAESRDDDTGKHLDRTQIYCRMLAEHLGRRPEFQNRIDAGFVENVFHASPLHDIGKVAVPDAVLCKPGKLTPEEFTVMQTHTVKGSETLSLVSGRFPSNAFLRIGMEIARSHHEKWNGRGYPDAKAGDAIPLAARIMAVADVYDALTSKRCYKEPMAHDAACEVILAEAGSHFDPQITTSFAALADEFDAVRMKLGN